MPESGIGIDTGVEYSTQTHETHADTTTLVPVTPVVYVVSQKFGQILLIEWIFLQFHDYL